jgi:protein CWC15
MSSAHRPTWDPAKGRADERHKSARLSSREMPSHTKLKFRAPPQKVMHSNEANGSGVKDLSQEGLHSHVGDVNPSTSKSESTAQLVNQKADTRGLGSDSSSSSSDDDSSSSDDEDDEDETTALMRELEKIKRERAEEKERLERERAEMAQSTREEEIALGNPLLNLEKALRGGGSESTGSTQTGFGVKRRWDDDSVFKNQAAGGGKDGNAKGFVNDLTRSDFHKRFMQRYVQ